MKWLFGGLVLLASAYIGWAAWRPLPAIRPSIATQQLKLATPAPQIAWPSAGQSAVSVVGSNNVLTHGAQTPVPTASTAKVITALLVLQKKPLGLGQSGSMITITADDVARYKAYLSQEGSVLPVQAGEQLSEYQMLQAMMLPSANNIADTLAIWAYGSLAAYGQAANAFLAQHQLINTHVGSDASGLAPTTTSTAANLVAIGKLAMANPVLAQIVGQGSATGFPIVSTLNNVNGLLGKSGIIGIKTGNSDQAGGVFLGAAKTTVNGKPVTVITAIMGAPDLSSALSASLPLIESAEQNFSTVQIYQKNAVVGIYKTAWGATSRVTVRKSVKTTAWRGEIVTGQLVLNPVKVNGNRSGFLHINATATDNAQDIALNLDTPLAKPTLKWRLLHPWH